MLKILFVTAAIAAALFTVKESDALQRAGLLSSCSEVAVPVSEASSWLECRGGKLDGMPDLSLKSCHSRGFAGSLEYWRCPAEISTELKP